MSLLDSIKAHYEEENSPPDGPDLDYVLVGGEWVKGETETKLVSHKDLDVYARWGTWFENVYRRAREVPNGDGSMYEFFAVKDCRPATESQNWGDYGKPEIYEVRPRVETVTVTYYDKVD